MTQEFNISVTPVGEDEYLVRTERVATGAPLAEEQVIWPVEDWLAQARYLMNDPLVGVLQQNPLATGDRAGTANSMQPSLNLVALGQKLYSALFQGTIRDSWMTAQGIAQHRQEVLQLRLGLKDPRLSRLPWEVLYVGNRPLAAGTDVVFSRYQPGTSFIQPSSAFREHRFEPQKPLRILMAIAAPTDQERLELKQEAMHLQEELLNRNSAGYEGNFRSAQTAEIQLTILDQPDREQLTRALEQGQFQVLHYAGHSNLGAAGGNLYLVSGKTGLTETLSGDDLAGLLVNNGIRMAVFNSCRGAYTAASSLDNERGEQNLAEALVKRGIPSVLAMAERIPDDVALMLTRLFYRNLKQGYPIDLSLSRARQGLISTYSSHQLYWALPILYLHPDFDGCLTCSTPPDLRTAADGLQAMRWRGPDPANRAGNYSAVPFGYSDATDPAIAADDEIEFPDPLSLEDDWDDLSLDPLSGDDSEDLDSLIEELEYEDEFSYDKEGDAALVSEIFQQLSTSDRANSVPDKPTVAATEEDLLPEDTALDTYLQSLPQPLPLDARSLPSATSYSNPGQSPSKSSGPSAVPGQASQPVVAQPSTKSASLNPLLGLRGWHRPNRLKTILWPLVGMSSLVAIALIGLWAWQRQPSPGDLLSDRLPSQSNSQQSQSLGIDPKAVDLETAETGVLAAAAIENFSQNNLAAGQQAVSELLDRGALPQANAALAAVPLKQQDNPGINFLQGRLAWQSVQTGDQDYSIDDARRFWETAVRQQEEGPQETGSPLAHYYNALGFAYFAEGNLNRANRAWFQALYLVEEKQTSAASPAPVTNDKQIKATPTASGASPTVQPQPNQEALTAYAGLALVLAKSAKSQPANQQDNLQDEAIQLYQKVMSENPVAFQPEALSKNWMWTEAAIQEWRSLPTLKAQ